MGISLKDLNKKLESKKPEVSGVPAPLNLVRKSFEQRPYKPLPQMGDRPSQEVVEPNVKLVVDDRGYGVYMFLTEDGRMVPIEDWI